MQVTVDSPFTTTLIDPSGGVENLGARVEVPVTREIVSYWRAATLDGGVWSVELDAPVTSGEYLLVWRTGDPEPPEFEAFIPLTASGTVISVTDFPLVDEDAVTPTVEDIARLERTRTATGGGGDTFEFGDTVFDENTRPTANEVQDLIEQAVPLVLSELPRAFPADHYESTKQAVALYTALMVEVSFFREQSDVASAPQTWQTLYTNSMINLKRLIDQDLAEWRKLRRMEPWPLPEPRSTPTVIN